MLSVKHVEQALQGKQTSGFNLCFKTLQPPWTGSTNTQDWDWAFGRKLLPRFLHGLHGDGSSLTKRLNPNEVGIDQV